MKKTLTFLAAVVLSGAATRADTDKIYRTRCQSCHGKTGGGNAALRNVYGPGLAVNDETTLEKPDDALAATIRDGGGAGKTHAFGGKLKSDEIAALVEHLREIAKKPAP